MDSFGTFLYQSGISIAVFYLFYWALLRRETWFTLNRILLFSSLLLAVAIPFVKITLHAAPEPGTVYYALDHYLMDGVIVHPATLAERTGMHLTAGNVLLLIYLAGALFFLVRFLIQIFQVLHLVHRYGIRDFEGYRIVPIDKEISPFSFFTLIFINTEKMQGDELHKVLLHEWEHVRRLHTLDILLLEIICIIQWFNPFVWLYKYSLHELHEYEADQAVLRRGENRLNYQQLILSQAFGHNFFPVVHNLINRSFIKKRIIMITKQKSKNITLLKSLLILPVAAILVVSFSFTREPANLQQVKILLNTGVEKISPAGEPAPPVSEPVPQTQPRTGTQSQKEASRQNDTTLGVFFIVEEMPKFRGGDINKFRQWVADQVRYPREAEENGIEGQVFVRFIVFPDGHVGSVKVVRSADPLLDAEAVRVIQSSPAWIPGKQRGHKVPVAYTVPVAFTTGKKEAKPAPAASPGGEVFFIVEEMPKFQGGTIDDFKQWVARQLIYPEDAAEKGISGRVFVSFIVEPDGSVSHVKVIKGSHPSLDAEAVRVVKSSLKWEPGIQRGHKVRVAVTIPVNFVMDHPSPAMEDIQENIGEQVVYVVDGKKIKKEKIKDLDASRVARVLVSTDEKDIKKYGPEARDGVIFITTYIELPEGKKPPKPEPPKK